MGIIYPLGLNRVNLSVKKMWRRVSSVPFMLLRTLPYDPQSAGINVQSPQSKSTPRRLTLVISVSRSSLVKMSSIKLFDVLHTLVYRRIKHFFNESNVFSSNCTLLLLWKLTVAVGSFCFPNSLLRNNKFAPVVCPKLCLA